LVGRRRKLLAVSDLHVRQPQNRRFIEEMPASKDDWLILGGDLGETEADLRFVFETLAPRFARLIWVPGNHELWTTEDNGLRGEALYTRLIEVCRSFGVLTPEDPYERFPTDDDEEEDLYVAPLFLLYDYTFRPDDITTKAEALKWAAEHDLVCTDEYFLHYDPHESREAWCHKRVKDSEARLEKLIADHPMAKTILINHFPLRRDHAFLPRVPRFSIWCGTRLTEDWHRRFHAKAVVFGHLHIRQKRVVDDVPFHEVSLGYRSQWDATNPDRYTRYIREILA
jgi:predicted phosphodiesterase